MNNVFIKTAMATAIVAATAGTAIANVDLYGRLRAGVVCTDNGADTDCALENRSSRFGIKASHKVNNALDAYGRYEFEVDLPKAQINTNAGKRLAYVGVKGGFGDFSIGTRWSPMYNTIAGPVDPFQLLGGTSGKTSYASTYRNQDSINFKKKYGMFSVHAQAMMGKEITTTTADVTTITGGTTTTVNGVTTTIGATTVTTPGVTTTTGGDTFDALELGAAFKLGATNLGLALRDDKTNNYSEVGIHTGTKFGRVGVGISYIAKDADINANDTDTIMALVDYGFGGGKKVSLSLGQISKDSGDDATNASIEYEHKLSKKLRWFAAAQTSNAGTDVNGAAAVDDVNKFGVGMRLEF